MFCSDQEENSEDRNVRKEIFLRGHLSDDSQFIFSDQLCYGMNPTRETYCFRNMMAEVGSKHSHQKGKTTYIYLSGNAYEYSYMTRSFFIDYKRMLFKNQITYTFKRGILGMKIRKDFEFTYNENCMNR